MRKILIVLISFVIALSFYGIARAGFLDDTRDWFENIFNQGEEVLGDIGRLDFLDIITLPV